MSPLDPPATMGPLGRSESILDPATRHAGCRSETDLGPASLPDPTLPACLVAPTRKGWGARFGRRARGYYRHCLFRRAAFQTNNEIKCQYYFFETRSILRCLHRGCGPRSSPDRFPSGTARVRPRGPPLRPLQRPPPPPPPVAREIETSSADSEPLLELIVCEGTRESRRTPQTRRRRGARR